MSEHEDCFAVGEQQEVLDGSALRWSADYGSMLNSD